MHPRSGWFGFDGGGWVFPVAIAWKLLLVGLFALPLPANDSFFFDGAVAHLLDGGGYFNPSIARVFPISGTEHFCAYPPFYQAVLLGWMRLFGTSSLSSLWLHALLFALFALVAGRILRRLGASGAALNLAGLFLFGMTFHDRPDSVAHVTGALALLLWIRALESPSPLRRGGAVLLVILTWGTSIHIGAMYTAMLWMLALLRSREERFPWMSALAMAVLPIALAAGVALAWPRLWEGFTENLLATPSFTGYRLPARDEVLKVLRTAPGLLLVGAACVLPAVRFQLRRAIAERLVVVQVFVAVTAAGWFTVAATLFVVAPNYVNVAAYPQVLSIGLFASLVLPGLRTARVLPQLRPALVAAAALVSIRAIGLTTWGVACARDVSRTDAINRVRQAAANMPAGEEVLVSAAYLYEFPRSGGVVARHADWVGGFGEGPGALRPRLLVLTAYDFHRRYQESIMALAARGKVRIVSVAHDVRVPPPERFPEIRRVVQHLSWAPVIVQLEWLP